MNERVYKPVLLEDKGLPLTSNKENVATLPIEDKILKQLTMNQANI